MEKLKKATRHLYRALVFAAALACWGQVLAAVDYDRQNITIAITQEPPNLDSSRTTDLVSFRILGHVNEGLVRYDRRGRVAPQLVRDAVVFDLPR